MWVSGKKQKMRHSLCDRDLDPNQIGDLGANHRAPQSILSCGPRRGLQKHKTPRRSSLSLAISAEVKAFIWTGLLFSTIRRRTAFYRTGELPQSFPRTVAIPAAICQSNVTLAEIITIHRASVHCQVVTYVQLMSSTFVFCSVSKVRKQSNKF